MGGRDIQPLVMCGRCKFEGQMEKVGRCWWWGIYPGAQICGLIVYLSDQCQNPALCYHVAIVLCRDTVGRHARAGIAVTTPSKPPECPTARRKESDIYNAGATCGRLAATIN